jgi:hypothetical protein
MDLNQAEAQTDTILARENNNQIPKDMVKQREAT